MASTLAFTVPAIAIPAYQISFSGRAHADQLRAYFNRRPARQHTRELLVALPYEVVQFEVAMPLCSHRL